MKWYYLIISIIMLILSPMLSGSLSAQGLVEVKANIETAVDRQGGANPVVTEFLQVEVKGDVDENGNSDGIDVMNEPIELRFDLASYGQESPVPCFIVGAGSLGQTKKNTYVLRTDEPAQAGIQYLLEDSNGVENRTGNLAMVEVEVRVRELPTPCFDVTLKAWTKPQAQPQPCFIPLNATQRLQVTIGDDSGETDSDGATVLLGGIK